LPPDPTLRCANRCIFCFIDQNPRSLRPSLYVKDEDYRLSLLHGNYVTLTNLGEAEIERIVAQRLSPLYVSVHATDPATRRSLLRPSGDGEIMPLLTRLARGGVEMHAQIVIVPGYNDGAVLVETLDDLEGLGPALLSVAIVPVGLTSHRQGLPPLRRPTPAEAGEIIALVSARQAAGLARWGRRVFFPADEFYLLAGQPLPRAEAYESFPQIENGVGLVRALTSELGELQRLFAPAEVIRTRAPLGAPGDAAIRAGIVTGVLLAPLWPPLLKRALIRTGEAGSFDLRVVAVQNRLFGPAVTVAGLLGGREVIAQLGRGGPLDLAVLPPEMFNAEGVTLDEIRATDVAREVGVTVQVGLGGDRPLFHPE
jgi:putative radical SAM enzyme (TIGR03279 family)